MASLEPREEPAQQLTDELGDDGVAKELAEQQHLAAISIQRAHRRRTTQKQQKEATIKVQSAYRGHRGRQQLQQQKVAATTIQST